MDAIDHTFVAEHTTGFEAAADAAVAASWTDIQAESGGSRADIERFARLLVDRPNAIFVWSMGLTQHVHGVDTIRALLNVGLARGLVGRAHRGLMPMRGHSGVQGGAEVGCTPVVDAEARDRWSALVGRSHPGRARPHGRRDDCRRGSRRYRRVLDGRRQLSRDRGECGAHAGGAAAAAPARPSRHRALVVDARGPVGYGARAARDDALRNAGRRHRDLDGAADHLLAGNRGTPDRQRAPRVVGARRRDCAREAGRGRSAAVCRCRRHPRRDRARHSAVRRASRRCRRPGDQVQWGGPRLFDDGEFATPDGRARLRAVGLRGRRLEPGTFFVSTRRGKQFNSMVQRDVDPLTGAPRDAVLLSAERCCAAWRGRRHTRAADLLHRHLRRAGVHRTDASRQSRGALARRARAARCRARRSRVRRARLQRRRPARGDVPAGTTVTPRNTGRQQATGTLPALSGTSLAFSTFIPEWVSTRSRRDEDEPSRQQRRQLRYGRWSRCRESRNRAARGARAPGAASRAARPKVPAPRISRAARTVVRSGPAAPGSPAAGRPARAANRAPDRAGAALVPGRRGQAAAPRPAVGGARLGCHRVLGGPHVHHGSRRRRPRGSRAGATRIAEGVAQRGEGIRPDDGRPITPRPTIS